MGRPKPLPFREIKRRLKGAGFSEAGQKGSHVKFIRRSGAVVETAIVPRKHEVPSGRCAAFSTKRTLIPTIGKSFDADRIPGGCVRALLEDAVVRRNET